MKKLLLGTIVLTLVIIAPFPTMAEVNIGIGISLPPIEFNGPPDVVAMPDTDDVYFVPDINLDMFFWNGWWWRPWEGRWYRSQYYDRGWAYYDQIPSFYFDIDPGWRGHYRNHNWYGHRWDYERIPYQNFQQNWNSWHNNRHWEKQRTWGVQSYQPLPEQQRQEIRNERQRYHQQYHGQGQQHHGESQHQQSHEKHEGGDSGHRE
ncbi:MAG: hypothetical protein OS130_04945 [Thermodesulfobacteriota bacterium]|nr:MAG: hypothetical protein OS130_04945 [Thermodesulfobacteriota bacterium]